MATTYNNTPDKGEEILISTKEIIQKEKSKKQYMGIQSGNSRYWIDPNHTVCLIFNEGITYEVTSTQIKEWCEQMLIENKISLFVL